MLRQVASKLQLVSAFVREHTTAQQVLSRHLSERLSCDNLDSKAPAPGTRSHSSIQNSEAPAPNCAPGDMEAERVTHQVLRESRAEADAALQYARQVIRVPRQSPRNQSLCLLSKLGAYTAWRCTMHTPATVAHNELAHISHCAECLKFRRRAYVIATPVRRRSIARRYCCRFILASAVC